MALTYLQTASSGGFALTTYTFASQNLGAAAGDRLIIVAIGYVGAPSAFINTVTVAGVTAAVVQDTSGNANSPWPKAAIAVAAVPTGTSGNVVVTFHNAGPTGCSASLYRGTGLKPTPKMVAGSTATSPSASLNVPAGGSAVAAATGSFGSVPSWSNLTGDYLNSVNGRYHMAGSTTLPAGNASLSATAVFGGGFSAGAFASFEPVPSKLLLRLQEEGLFVGGGRAF